MGVGELGGVGIFLGGGVQIALENNLEIGLSIWDLEGCIIPK